MTEKMKMTPNAETIAYMTRTRNIVSGFWAGVILHLAVMLDVAKSCDEKLDENELAENTGRYLVRKAFDFPAYLSAEWSRCWDEVEGAAKQALPSMLSSVLPSILGSLAGPGQDREQIPCAGCGMINFRGDECPRCGSLVGGVSE